jgi:hypothetical protein
LDVAQDVLATFSRRWNDDADKRLQRIDRSSSLLVEEDKEGDELQEAWGCYIGI